MVIFLIIISLTYQTLTPYKGDFHLHSLYSDGRNSIKEMVETYLKEGYSFIIFTDHNTMFKGEWKTYKGEIFSYNTPSFKVLPGLELTYKNMHLNALGIEKFIGKEVPPKEAVDSVVSYGGFLQINHIGLFSHWNYDFIPQGAIEVWNLSCGDWREGMNLEAYLYWIKQLKEGKKFIPLTNSDAHYTSKIGKVYTYVYSPDLGSVFESLQKGRIYGSDCPQMEVKIWVDSVILGETYTKSEGVLKVKVRACSKIESVLVFKGRLNTAEKKETFTTSQQEVFQELSFSFSTYGWLRVEVYDSLSHKAYSAPIYVNPKKERTTHSEDVFLYVSTFSPTKIKYFLPPRELPYFIILKLYSHTGRLICPVIEGKYQEWGMHSVEIVLPSFLSSGVYFYHLIYDNSSISSKFILF